MRVLSLNLSSTDPIFFLGSDVATDPKMKDGLLSLGFLIELINKFLLVVALVEGKDGMLIFTSTNEFL